MTHPQLLSWHVLLLLAALLTVLITDACGLVYLIGWRQRMNGVCLRLKHGFITSMGAAAVGTGLLLVVSRPEVLTQMVFWMKMVFVAALFVNGWLMGRKIPWLTSGPFRTLAPRARWSLALGSMASLVFWIGASLLGLMI